MIRKNVRIGLNRSIFAAEQSPSWPWVLWFALCLIPFSLPGGYSANYLIALTPVFWLLAGGKIYYPPSIISLFILLCLVVFFVASVYQVDQLDNGFRRIISFILFMASFSLVFIPVDFRIRNAFCFALILIACFYSAIAIYKYFAFGLAGAAADAKGAVGTQRLGFLYIVAFWILVDYLIRGGVASKLRYLAVLVTSILILVGIIFTFSRASYVALTASFLIFPFFYRSKIALLRFSTFFRLAGVILVVLFGFSVLAIQFPAILGFIEARLIDPAFSGEMYYYATDPGTSEGRRIAIWSEILDYVIANPVTGSGFLGIYFVGDSGGSAHSQYFDVLLRLGLIGFFMYFYLNIKLASFLARQDKALFVGFCGVLVFGLFHETFKLSQGVVIFAFLVGYYATALRGRSSVARSFR